MRFLLASCAALLAAGSALADDAVHLSIRDHKYEPARIEVPAGVKFKLLVKNEDPTPEEFESFDLKREKVVPPGQEIAVFLGPLDAGEYKFVGDFHQDTAQGVMVAK
ncbi:MAG: Cupredoxin-like domain [Rhodospirillales bacterium]|nr:Cupredoxin-like domain [Rhodospirillales bacterium]